MSFTYLLIGGLTILAVYLGIRVYVRMSQRFSGERVIVCPEVRALHVRLSGALAFGVVRRIEAPREDRFSPGLDAWPGHAAHYNPAGKYRTMRNAPVTGERVIGPVEHGQAATILSMNCENSEAA